MSAKKKLDNYTLSFVVPMYNEQEGAAYFHKSVLLPQVKAYARGLYEIIYVNDGSSDSTLDILQNIAETDHKVKVINLSRNFGKEIATTAGITRATGDAIIILDGDGQHPPKIIGDFINKWLAGAMVVIGIRNSNKDEGIVKKYGSKLFYKIFNSTSGAKIVPRSTDFRLIDKVVQNEFIKFTERHRITRGLIDWLGFKRDYVYFDSPARLAGTASYKTTQLFRLAMNSFVSLSLQPLFIFGWVGVFIVSSSTLFGLFIIVEQFILHDPMRLHFSGSAMLGVFMSFLIGIVLISQAILATYVSHIHTQTQGRPLFIIDYENSSNITPGS